MTGNLPPPSHANPTHSCMMLTKSSLTQHNRPLTEEHRISIYIYIYERTNESPKSNPRLPDLFKIQQEARVIQNPATERDELHKIQQQREMSCSKSSKRIREELFEIQ